MTPPIIKREHVRVSATPSRSPGASSRLLKGVGEKPRAGESGVRLLHEGEEVCAIEFTCKCGDVTVVELEYPVDSANEPN